MSLPRLYPKKARSARLLGCKRPRDGLQSLPPFWEPCFYLQMTFLRFPLNRGKALICHCPSSSEKSPVCLRCSVFCKTFAYHLCAVKRLTALFCFGGPTAFFRQCVPLFAQNANAQNFCLRETGILNFFFMFSFK